MERLRIEPRGECLDLLSCDSQPTGRECSTKKSSRYRSLIESGSFFLSTHSVCSACRGAPATSGPQSPPSPAGFAEPFDDQRIVYGSGHCDQLTLGVDQRRVRQFAAPARVDFKIEAIGEIVREAVMDQRAEARLLQPRGGARLVSRRIGVDEDNVRDLASARRSLPIRGVRRRRAGRSPTRNARRMDVPHAPRAILRRPRAHRA